MKNRIQPGTESGQIHPRNEVRPVEPAEVLAHFGEAVLIRVGARIVLRGGTMADRTEALEWMALFMPDAVTSLQ